MSINCNNILNDMIEGAPTDIENIDLQISQIELQQDALDQQITMIDECVMIKAKEGLTAYLQGAKMAEIQNAFPNVYLVFGSSYGSTGYPDGSITDWEYRNPDGEGGYSVVYDYRPGDDEIIDNYVNDYEYGNDYIYHPVEPTAAYGLQAMYDLLSNAIAILLNKRNMVERSVDVFTRYIT